MGIVSGELPITMSHPRIIAVIAFAGILIQAQTKLCGGMISYWKKKQVVSTLAFQEEMRFYQVQISIVLAVTR